MVPSEKCTFLKPNPSLKKAKKSGSRTNLARGIEWCQPQPRPTNGYRDIRKKR
jgi:hypothetical protein